LNFNFYLTTVKAVRRQQIIFKIFYIRSWLVNKRKKTRERYKGYRPFSPVGSYERAAIFLAQRYWKFFVCFWK